MAGLQAEVEEASVRLTATLDALPGEGLGRPSLLPGWTIGHVLTHLARNADGLRNLLLAARSGEPVRMYASPATRAADLEAGVRRPADVVIADAAASAARFVIEARLVPTEAWNAQVAFTSGLPNPPLIAATKLLDFRLREVEFHHVDLGGPYGFASTPRSTVTLLLDDTLVRLNRADFVVRPSALDGEWIVTPGERDVVVRAGRPELLAWLSGRSASGVTPLGGELPEVPSLG